MPERHWDVLVWIKGEREMARLYSFYESEGYTSAGQVAAAVLAPDRAGEMAERGQVRIRVSEGRMLATTAGGIREIEQ